MKWNKTIWSNYTQNRHIYRSGSTNTGQFDILILFQNVNKGVGGGGSTQSRQNRRHNGTDELTKGGEEVKRHKESYYKVKQEVANSEMHKT